MRPPTAGIGNRPGAGNIANNRPISDRPVNINNGNINTGNIGSGNRYGRVDPGYGVRAPYGGRYGGWHNGNWGYGSWHYGNYWPSPWYGAGAAAMGWAVGTAGSYLFSNPYYEEDSGGGGGGGDNYVYNYSQPIAAPPTEVSSEATATAAPYQAAQPAAAAPGAAPPAAAAAENPNINPQAMQQFDAARASFKQGKYPAAQSQVEAAIKLMPDDAVLHEFRALCLFAQKKYDQAAGVLYAVLGAGPGWDWNTLQALYPNQDVYTQQLRALEDYVKQHDGSAPAHFVLAYQYMCIGDGQSAAGQLAAVTKIQPKDQLSAALLKSMKETPAATAA